MATSYLFIFLIAPLFFCAVLSTPTTSPVDETDKTEDVLKGFSQEVAELKDIVGLLQDHIITQDDGSHTARQQHLRDVHEFFVGRRFRNKRSGDGDIALTLNNDSAVSTEDLSRTLYSYHTNPPSGGAVYTRWGRDDCAKGSELVYAGMATGAYYSHTGGGVNYLCLPHEPLYSDVETSAHATRSLLYSAEFETSTAQALQDLQDQTPACAVCRAPPTRLTKLMIPGRNVCPSSKWRLEYKGYLMSSLYTHKARTDFVCMDEDAKAVPGTTGNQHGALFYMVEARCSAGGLQCGPYVNGYELTCAVCTI